MSTLLTIIVYGVFGWSVEIIYTSVTNSWKNASWQLKGVTYLWMFPIYGLGGLAFQTVHTFFLSEGLPLLARLPLYIVGLYVLEFIFGILLLKLTGDYIWKYYGKWQYKHIVNFTLAPAWLIFLFLLEVIHDFLNRITIA